MDNDRNASVEIDLTTGSSTVVHIICSHCGSMFNITGTDGIVYCPRCGKELE